MNRKYIAIIIAFVLLTGICSFCLRGKNTDNVFDKNYYVRWKESLPTVSNLKTGDLIVRHGKGFVSDAFRYFSRKDKRYSHAGIISIQNGRAYVYHAIGGEENTSNNLRKETLNEFCNPEKINSYAVYTYHLCDSQRKQLDSIMRNYYTQGLQFDTHFDLKTENAMYCSELVYKALLSVTHDMNYISLSSLNGMSYVGIDDLYMNSNCKLVCSR